MVFQKHQGAILLIFLLCTVVKPEQNPFDTCMFKLYCLIHSNILPDHHLVFHYPFAFRSDIYRSLTVYQTPETIFII